ncbi:MAG: NYN domain-containing protein [Lachnospiraceae bacterium]|nr:NYN domain-containing protein [Lachnospiraceae bacterium]
MEQNDRRFAVLIDADNVSPKYIKYILDEVSDIGIATYKRIYGDWTDNEKKSWKNVLLDWSVNPIQQYSYTTGKNATDSAMIIDAMDILYSGNVDGFCLVSSDSDFTKLAQRLREAGMFVMGIGEQKTPKPFRAACDTFKLLEIISSEDAAEPTASAKGKTTASGKNEVASMDEIQKTITSRGEIEKAITKLLIENNSQNQPIILAKVGNFLTKRFSDFDVRNYGYSKLSTFLENLDNNDFQVVKLHGGYFVQEKSASIPLSEIEKEIVRIIQDNNGHVDNLSVIHEELKKVFPSFDVKQYGFSRLSSFIRSFGTFRIKDNMVQMR